MAIKMILSTLTSDIADRTSDENAVELIAKAGFDAVDYSMFSMQDEDNILNTSKYEKHVMNVLDTAKNCGVYFNQAHAPFPSYRVGDEKYNGVIYEKLKRSLEIAGILGVKNIVVHPTDFQLPSEENVKKNYEFYMALQPLCKEYGVKIAVENMFGCDKRRDYVIPNICSVPDEFCRMVDMLDPQYFTACLDIGHAGLVGSSAPELINALGHDRLTCLHVHDNNYRSDCHMPPFFHDLDWEEITQALADIEYTGDFTFEANAIFNHFPTELFGSVLGLMNNIGRFLITRIEEKI